MRMEMVNPQEIILYEISSGATQKNVAMTYAFILRQEPNAANWIKINAAIRARWPKKGLDRVKEMAWKFHGGGKP